MHATNTHRRRPGRRRGFIIGGLVVFIIFYVGFCYQTWKHGHAAAKRRREAQRQAAALKASQPPPRLHQSPDGTLAFYKKRKHNLSLDQQWTLVTDKGNEHVIYDGAGRLSIEWRPDSKGFCLEETKRSKRQVTLFYIRGDGVTAAPLLESVVDSGEVRALCGDPDSDEFAHQIQMLGYREDGKLQISWMAHAKNRGGPSKRFVRQFVICCDNPDEIYITQTFR